MLRVKALAFGYGDNILFSNITFDLSTGEVLHIAGQNGRGKTTLLKVIAGLLPPDSGSIRYNHQTIAENRSLYHSQLTFIGHKLGLNPSLNLKENYLDYYTACPELFNESMDYFKLQPLINLPIQTLSAGQKRKAALIRLMLAQSQLWLLDEPFNNLDAHTSQLLCELMIKHGEEGGKIILTSHQPINAWFENLRVYSL